MKMIYYIVINEWNYPTESGRTLIGDYDTLEEAEEVSKNEYEKEYNNFQEVNKGEIYSEACGKTSEGYMLNSSKYEEENMYFISRIIEIDSFI